MASLISPINITVLRETGMISLISRINITVLRETGMVFLFLGIRARCVCVC